MKRQLAIILLLLCTGAQAVEMPVAARALARGAVVSIEDINWLDIVAGQADVSIADASNIVGLELKRSRAAGEPFRSNDLGPPTLVRRGQAVTLLVSGGGFQLATSGKSLQDGARNAVVRVQSSSNRILEGRVVDATTVQIATHASLQPTAR